MLYFGGEYLDSFINKEVQGRMKNPCGSNPRAGSATQEIVEESKAILSTLRLKRKSPQKKVQTEGCTRNGLNK